MSSCVVCERATSGSLEFCQRHYAEYKEDIMDKKPWVRHLKNEAQRERRRREKEYDNTSLDQILDRTYVNERW
jgi:hypothetical protein